MSPGVLLLSRAVPVPEGQRTYPFQVAADAREELHRKAYEDLTGLGTGLDAVMDAGADGGDEYYSDECVLQSDPLRVVVPLLWLLVFTFVCVFNGVLCCVGVMLCCVVLCCVVSFVCLFSVMTVTAVPAARRVA